MGWHAKHLECLEWVEMKARKHVRCMLSAYGGEDTYLMPTHPKLTVEILDITCWKQRTPSDACNDQWTGASAKAKGVVSKLE